MRVAPRSVSVASMVSATICSTLAALDATGQVQLTSPTVRKRTDSSSTVSPARGGVSGVTGTSNPRRRTTAAMRVIDRRQIDRLATDVLPYIELGPVADQKYAHVLAGVHAGVIEVPQLGPLVTRVPLPELVAQGEHALLCA